MKGNKRTELEKAKELTCRRPKIKKKSSNTKQFLTEIRTLGI